MPAVVSKAMWMASILPRWRAGAMWATMLKPKADSKLRRILPRRNSPSVTVSDVELKPMMM